MSDLLTLPRLIVPPLEEEPWPTLGPDVCDWIETYLVHGPGDMLGEPITLTDELRLFVYRAYEVYPESHELAGRRRFKRVCLSRRKGVGKTEIAAWVALAEMDPGAPVRADGWRTHRGERVPVGRGIRDPYIPMVATTEEQSDELAYGTAYHVLLRCELGNEYDIGIERIEHRSEPGRMQALASAPSARDGARTTFQHFDETHLFVSERLTQSHATMLRNVPKRIEADAWSLETTTMYEPGEGSVAEGTHEYAIAVLEGKITAEESRLFFDHRQASEKHNLETKRGLGTAIREASGDAIAFTDVPAITSQYHDPQTDRAAFRRYWLNQRVKGSRRWISVDLVRLRQRKRKIADGARVVLGFDGSSKRDSTALVGCTIEAIPHVFVIGKWIRPKGVEGVGWRVNRTDVLDACVDAIERFDTVEFACDPPGWHREIEELEEIYGDDVVVRFETIQPKRMGPAAESFLLAMGADDEITIDPDPDLEEHLGNAVSVNRRGYLVPTKESSDSEEKIDLAIGAVIAYSRAHWHLLHGDGDDLVALTIDPVEEVRLLREHEARTRTRRVKRDPYAPVSS